MGSFFITFWIIDCKWLEEDEGVDWVDENVEPYLLIGENGDGLSLTFEFKPDPLPWRISSKSNLSRNLLRMLIVS